jgi:hypothetical protein
MNFLYRTAVQPAAPAELPRIPEDVLQKPATTLEGLIIAEDSYHPSSVRSDDGAANNGPGDNGADSASLASKNPVQPGTHTDVTEDEGWITIPYSWVTLTFLSFLLYTRNALFASYMTCHLCSSTA